MTMDASWVFCIYIRKLSRTGTIIFLSLRMGTTYVLNYQTHFSHVLDKFADCRCFDIEVFAIGCAVAVGDGPVAEEFRVE